MIQRTLIVTGALAAMMAIPEVASACAVCFDPHDATNGAFLASTIALSLLPLSLIGGVICFLWYRARVLREEERPRPAE